MNCKILSSILIVTSLNLFISCTSPRHILKDELEKDDIIYSAMLSSGEHIKFDANGASYGIGGIITGLLENGDSLTISMEKVREIRVDKVPSIKLDNIKDEDISEVVLKNNQVIRLNSGYKEKYNGGIAIIGKSLADQEIIIKEDKIHEVRVSKPSSISKSDLAKNPEIKIFEVVTYPKNRLYRFDSNGANLSDYNYVYSGWTIDGRYADVPADEIVSVRTDRLDATNTTKSAMYVVGITVLIVLILGIIVLSQTELDFDWK